MDSAKFQEIISVDVKPVLKALAQKRRSKKGKDAALEELLDSLPPYFEGWTQTVKEYFENRVHSEEVFPVVLFKNIAPNQSVEELEYIKHTHQCVTSDVFLEFSNTVKRGLINGNIEFKDEEGRDAIEFKKYIEESIPQYKSLYEYMKSLVDEKLTDANAVCAVNFTAETDDEGTIEGRLQPFPEIYHAERVVYVDPDESIVVMAHERSIVQVGSQQVREGYVFNCYTKTSYFQARQIGKKSDYKFEYTEFDHDLGWCPAMRLMGSPRLIENKLYFTSPFHRAVFNLNLALLDNANLLLIKRKVGYPTRVFVAEKCRHQHNGVECDNGRIKYSDGSGMVDIECPACKGTGTVGVFGPNSELHINKSDGLEGQQIKAQDAMSYVSPPIETPEFLRKEIDGYILKAERVLHLKAEPRSAGNITATEKNIDLKATEGFIKPISDQVWHLYAFLMKTIGSLIYGVDSYEKFQPKVIPAKEFDIISTDDYLAQLAEARKSNQPGYVVQMIIYNMMKSMNYTDSMSEMLFNLIQFTDRLWANSSQEVAMSLSRGTATKWEVILHESILAFIFELAEEDEGFYKLELEQQKEALIAKAKAVNAMISAESTVELPPPLEV
jgi:hypothetical protein